jgi:hypothetical protein
MFRTCPIMFALLVAGVPMWSSIGVASNADEASIQAPTRLTKKATSKDCAQTRHPCRGQVTVAPCLITIGQAAATDAPVNIISDHIRRQGYSCDEPRQAEYDRAVSRPNEAVWVLRCGNAAYRVTLIPDMAARVEVVK